jgi:hypothetical protein
VAIKAALSRLSAGLLTGRILPPESSRLSPLTEGSILKRLSERIQGSLKLFSRQQHLGGHVEAVFKGSLYYWVPGVFPAFPWYTPFGMSLVSVTLTDIGLTISGPWPFLSRGWRGAYSEIERVDITLFGVRFWFRRESPMTFRTNRQDDLLRALKQHDVQIGVKQREVG